MRILGAVLITIAMFVATMIAVTTISRALPESVAGWLSPPLTTVVVFGLLYAYRRWTGRPWSGLGLTRTWWALPQVLLGLAAGLLPLLAANAVSVWAGAATWAPPEPRPPAILLLGLALIVLRAALPEEVLYRGHLYDVLTDRLGPNGVLAVTTLSFGALHILSQSPASGIGEKLLFMVQATAMGLLCGACRERTGAVWMPVGVHTAVYVNLLIPAPASNYGAQLALQTAALTLTAAAVLVTARRESPRPAR
ncbi:type II CAAX endopeptidase family protein [Nonomuraea sp. NPDC050404]|uniref:CPBP family intramembrane glutamic endopeptidase n=1 Tax=Nonomuraea sp. NPDC050404 TaxID=3155783 RepID=UPI0033E3D215